MITSMPYPYPFSVDFFSTIPFYQNEASELTNFLASGWVGS
jgi:hypothetical protein